MSFMELVVSIVEYHVPSIFSSSIYAQDVKDRKSNGDSRVVALKSLNEIRCAQG